MSNTQALAARRHCLAAMLVTMGLPTSALATSAAFSVKELGDAWQDLPLRGRSMYRFWGLEIYEASLWLSPEAGLDWASNRLVLSLLYQRSFSAQAIVERSLQEMQKQGALSPPMAQQWQHLLSQVLTDVRAGERLTVTYLPQRGLRFWHHARRATLLGEMTDLGLCERFLGIWLSSSSTAPTLRQALLGIQS